jgi:2-polyprenyl-6-hydroxyphenyl methylase/3-demethylubiquinone-9 3-methyltransferase
VVTSSVGAIFAPHHQAVADELLRVCRPGGVIGMIALVPSGATREMFELVAHYAPGLIGEESPLLWGSEEHVRALFGGRVASLSLKRRRIEHNLAADVAFLKTHHPVFVTIYRQLSDNPDGAAVLDRQLAGFESRWLREPQQLLLIVAHKNAAA